MRRIVLAVVVTGVAYAAFAACDPYGTQSDSPPSSDGGGPGGDDGSLASDGSNDGSSGDGPLAHANHVAVLGGRALDGTTQSKVYVATVLANGDISEWKETTPMPEARSRGAAVIANGTFVYIAGEGPADALTETPLTAKVTSGGAASWTSGASLGQSRFRHGAVAIANRVYAIGGGSTVGEETATVLVADVPPSGLIGTWTPTTPLPEGRSSIGTATDGKHVYVIAGDRTGDGATDTRTADGWVADVDGNGALGAWRGTPPLPLPTSSCGVAATSSHVYVSGGYVAGAYDYVVAAAIAADGSLGSWVALTSLKNGRARFAMVVADGHLYAIGGDLAGGAYSASVEVADVQPDGTLSAWRDTAALPIALGDPMAVAFDAPQ